MPRPSRLWMVLSAPPSSILSIASAHTSPTSTNVSRASSTFLSPLFPLRTLSTRLTFPLLTGIKKRNNKLLDYDRVRAQVKRLTEKPDKDVTKLPRTEKEAEMTRAAYDQLNEQLFNELPQLIELRVPYLDPSFEALVKIQLRFCAEAYSRMAQVQQYLDPDTRDQYANGNLDARVEQVLQEIRELSIAGTV
jgi:hypothetical protein